MKKEDDKVQKVDGQSAYISLRMHAIIDETIEIMPKWFNKASVMEGCCIYGVRAFIEQSYSFFRMEIDEAKKKQLETFYKKWNL